MLLLLLLLFTITIICEESPLTDGTSSPLSQCANDVTKFEPNADCKNEKDEIIGKLYGFEFDSSGCCYMRCKSGTLGQEDYKETLITPNTEQPESCVNIKDVTPKVEVKEKSEKECEDEYTAFSEDFNGSKDDDIIIDIQDDEWDYYFTPVDPSFYWDD